MNEWMLADKSRINFQPTSGGKIVVLWLGGITVQLGSTLCVIVTWACLCHYTFLCEMATHTSFTDTVRPNLNTKLCDLETESKDQRPKHTDTPWLTRIHSANIMIAPTSEFDRLSFRHTCTTHTHSLLTYIVYTSTYILCK